MIKPEELIGVKLLNPDLLDSTNKSYKVTFETFKSPNLIGEIIEANDNFVRVKFRDYEANFSKWYILKYLKLNLWVNGDDRTPTENLWFICYADGVRQPLKFNKHNQFWVALAGKTYKPNEIEKWLDA